MADPEAHLERADVEAIRDRRIGVRTERPQDVARSYRARRRMVASRAARAGSSALSVGASASARTPSAAPAAGRVDWLTQELTQTAVRVRAQIVGCVGLDDFRVLWAGYDVRFHRTGIKRFCHPLVGDLTLAYHSVPLLADPGLTLVVSSSATLSHSREARWALKRYLGPNAASRNQQPTSSRPLDYLAVARRGVRLSLDRPFS
jgi:hypothetical protein